MKKIILFLGLSIFLFANTNSQNYSKKAGESYNEFDFNSAIKFYNKVLEKSEDDESAILGLANSYYFLNDYSNAKVWYEKIYNIKKQTLNETYFNRYIQSLRSNRDYDMALEILKEYYKTNLEKLKKIAIQKQQLDSIIENPPYSYSINNLDINTPYSEFNSIIYKDRLIYTSAHDTLDYKNLNYKWNNQPYLNIFSADINFSSGQLLNKKLLFDNINTKYHDASVAISKDNKTIYYTRNNLSKNNKINKDNHGITNLEIVKADLIDNKIVNEKVMDFTDNNYSYGHPCLSPDEKYLFFVSDMPGSYGETDIWVVELFADGKNNSPVNLGPQINTVGREMFPFLTENILYFSSDGYYGFGGLDIYQALNIEALKYSTPVNLGEPLNSNMDDFTYVVSDTSDFGYFTSNRTLGKGDDDIYYFRKSKNTIYQNYSGFVQEEITKENLPDVNIKVLDLFDEEILMSKSDKDGAFDLKLEGNNNYKIIFEKQGYSSKTVDFKTSNENNKIYKDNYIYLTAYNKVVKVDTDGLEKIIVDPIYFDYDKWDITPYAIIELNKVKHVLEQFPDLKIKIESHTDSRGSDKYNLILSEKRANATRDFLIESGINSERIISAQGFGESKPINHCVNGVKCSEYEFLINRRSDFIIVK